LGRLVWALVADATGVATDVSVPWLRLALLVPAALVVTLAVSLVPGRDAARMRPAAVLRTE
jgi:ABC-type antimicrobial peptide transport system permease subunit